MTIPNAKLNTRQGNAGLRTFHRNIGEKMTPQDKFWLRCQAKPLG